MGQAPDVLPPPHPVLSNMRSVAVVAALVACLHAGAWALWQTQASAPDVEGVLNSVSYSPFTSSVHPDAEGGRPTEAQIRADLKALAPYTRAIRLYSSTGGVELVPPVAAEVGIKVTLGIWLDKNEQRNEREIRSALDLFHKNRNVNGIIVGNEVLFRRDMSADELTEYVKRIKREVAGAVPVTTGEIYSELLDTNKDGQLVPRPEAETLISKVDYIAAHVLPYWGGIPAEGAVNEAVRVYQGLRNAFPGKHVVIAEFGWPSAGYNRRAAEPGKLEQASVIRSFLSRAQALGIDYNLIEAYDQPWKTAEGSVGAYWGLFDNTHEPKFSWAGPIADGSHGRIALVAVAAGILISLPILAIAGATLGQTLLLAIAAHVVGAWVATVFGYWHDHYFVIGAAVALGFGTLLLIPLVLISLRRIEEIATILFGRPPTRLLPVSGSVGVTASSHLPKVSIHIPACMEPPDMLRATLDAVSRLAYPNFECILVVNNTPDIAMWQSVEAHCQTLGPRFKFMNAPKLEGYKAGALRLAQAHTAADAEIIGIIDSDYTVMPEWLTDLVPLFADPKVGLVQAPQDHRDGLRSPLHHAMNGEYAGFFDIGMVQRNETNSLIVHGTMCLIRRSALDTAGGWSSDTICEDTDLGLSMLERGWLAHYTRRRYGYGLLPDNFAAYKRQRDRWASGGFQIVRKHWRRFLPGTSRLTGDQKREFLFGWLNWMGAETVGVMVAILNLLWVPIVAFVGIAIPDKILTLPILATFAISLVNFAALYRRRVPITLGHATAAMVAAMAMQWTVARAVANGIFRDRLAFVRTAKGFWRQSPGARRRRQFSAFDEAIMGGLLLIGAAVVFETNFERVREVNLFGFVLVVQSLPFLAAVGLAVFENSRLNDFALWRNLETRLVEILPRELMPRRGEIETAAAAPEKIEAAQ